MLINSNPSSASLRESGRAKASFATFEAAPQTDLEQIQDSLETRERGPVDLFVAFPSLLLRLGGGSNSTGISTSARNIREQGMKIGSMVGGGLALAAGVGLVMGAAQMGFDPMMTAMLALPAVPVGALMGMKPGERIAEHFVDKEKEAQELKDLAAAADSEWQDRLSRWQVAN